MKGMKILLAGKPKASSRHVFVLQKHQRKTVLADEKGS